MKIKRPFHPVSYSPPLIGGEPPLYINDQITPNPKWLAWCTLAFGLSGDEMPEMIAEAKALNVFTSIDESTDLNAVLDKALKAFSTASPSCSPRAGAGPIKRSKPHATSNRG